ncbi:MAG: hypothetical protein JWQ57_1046 [Mucilaginibacter sp.]|nr:hypothetical protein [Mucilaginibacter sp.]
MKSQAINQVINLFWTILCFIPIYDYWIGKDITWLYVFVLFSLIPAVLPNSIFRHFQLSSNSKFYEHLRVKHIQKFVQNGTFINRVIRKKNPDYKIIKDRVEAHKYLGTINMYERYHVFCFIFLGVTFGHALYSQRYGAAFLILLANVIYNICPILIQQYNKLRVVRLLK